MLRFAGPNFTNDLVPYYSNKCPAPLSLKALLFEAYLICILSHLDLKLIAIT